MTTPTSDYQTALQAAKAQRQAQKAVGRPVTDVVAATAETTILVRERAAENAKRAIKALWQQTNPYDDDSVNRFASRAAKVMKSAQTTAGRAAASAMRQQLRALGIDVAPSASYPLDVRAAGIGIGDDGKIKLIRKPTKVDYSGAPGRGRVKVTPQQSTTEEVFKRPAQQYRYAESNGHSGRDAADERIDDVIESNLMLAQRLAQQELLAKAALPPPVILDNGKPYRYIDYHGKVRYSREKSKVTGFRRVIHPELSRGGTCGLCIAASDRIYHVHELLPIHDHCNCTIAPVTEDHDPGAALNDLDLSKFYEDAGGNTAAHLKRTRYKIDDHGELGAVLKPKKPYKGKGYRKFQPESNLAKVARRNIEPLQSRLDKLRASGADEKSAKVQYLKRTIARLQREL